MPEYRRAFQPGGAFFLTLITNFRRPFLTEPRARRLLRLAIAKTRTERPFELLAVVLLPDHLHWIMALPADDGDFSTRMRLFKARFTHWFLEAGAGESGRSLSRRCRRERGVWHRRFWEHTVRDEADFERICQYIHYNPVKHGYAACPHAWRYSSFQRFVSERRYDSGWQCACRGQRPEPLSLKDIERLAGE